MFHTGVVFILFAVAVNAFQAGIKMEILDGDEHHLTSITDTIILGNTAQYLLPQNISAWVYMPGVCQGVLRISSATEVFFTTEFQLITDTDEVFTSDDRYYVRIRCLADGNIHVHVHPDEIACVPGILPQWSLFVSAFSTTNVYAVSAVLFGVCLSVTSIIIACTAKRCRRR